MSDTAYREYLRNNYKSAKQELVSKGQNHAKKDVYGLLRSKYYEKKTVDDSPTKASVPTTTGTSSEPPKKTVTESKKPKLNLKGFSNLYKRLIKL